MLLAGLALVLVQDVPLPVLAGRVLAPDGSPAVGKVIAVDTYARPDADPILGADDIEPDGEFAVALARPWVERSGAKRVSLITIGPGAWLSVQDHDGRRLPLGQEIEIQLSLIHI